MIPFQILKATNPRLESVGASRLSQALDGTRDLCCGRGRQGPRHVGRDHPESESPCDSRMEAAGGAHSPAAKVGELLPPEHSQRRLQKEETWVDTGGRSGDSCRAKSCEGPMLRNNPASQKEAETRAQDKPATQKPGPASGAAVRGCGQGRGPVSSRSPCSTKREATQWEARTPQPESSLCSNEDTAQL